MIGGIELDLGQATIESPPARIEATIVIGGVELAVPPEWTVQLTPRVVAGDVADKRRSAQATGDGKPELIVEGLIAMGALELS